MRRASWIAWLRFWLRPVAFALALIASLVITTHYGLRSSLDLKKWLADNFATRIAPSPYWLIDGITNFLIAWAVLLLIATGVQWLLDRKQRNRQGHNTGETFAALPDVAIQLQSDDELDRLPFVRKLAKLVVLRPGASSAVIAIEAPWGAGKTSVLEMLLAELRKRAAPPIVVRFNPWIVSGHDSILRAFFSQFSAAFVSDGQHRLASQFLEFAESIEELIPAIVKSLPRRGLKRLRVLTGRVSVVDLEDEKKRISNLVEQVGIPIVVIVDDIDRLPPDDVRSMFRLVKAAADFPGVSYVLAFDPKPVDEALKFDGMYSDGKEFRDKIVQTTITLPRISTPTRRKFLEARFHAQASDWQFDLDNAEQSALKEAFPYALAVLRMPRDIKRVINNTMLSAEGLRREINIADIFIFECMHALFPNVTRQIRRRPALLNISDEEDTVQDEFSWTNRHGNRDEDAEKKQRAQRLAIFTDLYPEHTRDVAALLTFLFADVFPSHDIFSGGPFSPPAAARRLTTDSNLLIFLYQGLHGGILSRGEAIEFFKNPTRRRPYLSDGVQSDSLQILLAHLNHYADGAPPVDPASLLSDIIVAVNDQYTRSGIDCTNEARWLMTKIVSSAGEAKFEILDHTFGTTVCASASEELVNELLSDIGLWDEGKYLGRAGINRDWRPKLKWATVEQAEALKDKWLTSIRHVGVRDIISKFPNQVGVLFRWGQLADPPYQEVTRELERAFTEDADLAVRFITLFPPGIGLNGTEKMISNASRQILLNVIDSSEIPESIRERMQEHLETAEFT